MTLRDAFRALADELSPKASKFDWDGYRRLFFEYEGTDADRASIAELGWKEFSRQMPPAGEFSAASALPLNGDAWRQFVEAYYERDAELQDQNLQELYDLRCHEKRTC